MAWKNGEINQIMIEYELFSQSFKSPNAVQVLSNPTSLLNCLPFKRLLYYLPKLFMCWNKRVGYGLSHLPFLLLKILFNLKVAVI